MYCPQCGQRQLANDIRFCSQCGFPLAGVTTLLARGGSSEEVYESDSPRKKGVKQGVLVLMAMLVLAPVLVPFDVRGGPMILGVLFLIGILRVIYALAFQPGKADRRSISVPSAPHPQYTPPQGVAGPRQEALPSAYTPPSIEMPAEQRYDTGGFLAPPSVTEQTTRHLEQDRGNPRPERQPERRA